MLATRAAPTLLAQKANTRCSMSTITTATPRRSCANQMRPPALGVLRAGGAGGAAPLGAPSGAGGRGLAVTELEIGAPSCSGHPNGAPRTATIDKGAPAGGGETPSVG